MDFDPRWDDDPRDLDDRDRLRAEALAEVRELSQGSRGVSSDPLERNARDPRDVFTRDLDLPRGLDRERVWFREHSVLLRGSESRALATTGAFRVVHADQAPIGIHPDGRWILICLLTQDAKRELRTFLERHLLFLAALPTWTIRVVIPAHMTAHAMRFRRRGATKPALAFRRAVRRRPPLVLRNPASRRQPLRCVRR
ncbi:MAG: hypothetical protein IT176_05770 [Acidobacteria bacterium]|nr:hypothetical protein [Acidobacteriota bacterium]